MLISYRTVAWIVWGSGVLCWVTFYALASVWGVPWWGAIIMAFFAALATGFIGAASKLRKKSREPSDRLTAK